MEHLFETLTWQFLKVIFSACPQTVQTIPVLFFPMPLLPIISFTKFLTIFSTSQIFCQFSFLATLTPETLPPTMSYPDTCHLTHDTRFARVPTPQARPPTTHSRLLILQSQLLISHSQLPMFPSPGPRTVSKLAHQGDRHSCLSIH